MAPGYRSPFDHPLPPKSNDDHHHPDAILPFLAIILCVSLIFCLVLLSVRTATAHTNFPQQRRSSKEDEIVPPPDMAFDQAATMNIARPSSRRDAEKVMNTRDLLVRDQGCEVESGSVQQPLLSMKGHTGGCPLEQLTRVVDMAAREDDIHREGPISWHGTNTLNNSWGWMA